MTARVWDVDTWECLRVLEGHTGTHLLFYNQCNRGSLPSLIDLLSIFGLCHTGHVCFVVG